MPDVTEPATSVDRRAFMAYFGAIGLGSTLLPGALWAGLQGGAELTKETIACAEEIAGFAFSDDQREMMLADLRDQRQQLEGIQAVRLSNSVSPALHFEPLVAGMQLPRGATRGPVEPSRAASVLPASEEEIAFLPVNVLAHLIRSRQISSVELTRLYLDRITRYDPHLHAVVTVTEERAMRQARAADQEIASGRYRGPLHGIPWGAKDLLAVRGYPTTWGTPPFRNQVIDEDATVVQRLDAAGAVLIAKLTLGELAWGDVWFGGMTRNPWRLEQGSSGSSAGPGAATAAGLVAFAIGSETLGSIASPSTRNGVTGLRPTFGRVPKSGAMALAWSMDKLGPMCRSAEDCALVLDAIHGADGADLTARSVPFAWSAERRPGEMRIGYFRSAFERPETQNPNRAFDQATLAVLRSAGADLVPVEIPAFDYNALSIILSAEAAAAFDELTRSGKDSEMVRQERQAWPNSFRAARFIPAVEYINANRIRTLVMQAWNDLFRELDVIVTPTFAPGQLLATNLTGHPAVIAPNGFRDDGTPVSITFLGRLYNDSDAISLAHHYQLASGFHDRRPPLPTSSAGMPDVTSSES
jgi:Asp-tRNA(Asn)/Glu-tRNA(Gln) amidotransferase A subunit family amidase